MRFREAEKEAPFWVQCWWSGVVSDHGGRGIPPQERYVDRDESVGSPKPTNLATEEVLRWARKRELFKLDTTQKSCSDTSADCPRSGVASEMRRHWGLSRLCLHDWCPVGAICCVKPVSLRSRLRHSFWGLASYWIDRHTQNPRLMYVYSYKICIYCIIVGLYLVYVSIQIDTVCLYHCLIFFH